MINLNSNMIILKVIDYELDLTQIFNLNSNIIILKVIAKILTLV